METNYGLDELTSLHDAVVILIRSGVDITDNMLRYRLSNGQYAGQKIGNGWFIVTNELSRIQKEELEP